MTIFIKNIILEILSVIHWLLDIILLFVSNMYQESLTRIK